MNPFPIGKIVSKEIFIDPTGKWWMVSGFSDKDDNSKDWYNIYDYDLVSTGKNWESYFKKGHPLVKMVAMFDNDKEQNKKPMLSLDDLYELLLNEDFQWH